MLISPDDVLRRLDDPSLRICDVRWFLTEPGRGRRDYEAGHIPGAIFIDMDRHLVAPDGPGRHPLPSPAAFAARMGKLGIGSEHEVVAYDQGGGTIAARLWWMLDALGHARVRLLDGGWPAWLAAGGQIATDEPSFPSASLRLASEWPRTIQREELRTRLGDVKLVDVRAPERYRGETEPVDPMAGHIPTAVNLPTTGNVGPDGRFLAPEALRSRFAGLTGGDEPLVVHCGSGINACHTLFALRLSGAEDALLYPGSYSDWSRSGEQVASGADPGEPR